MKFISWPFQWLVIFEHLLIIIDGEEIWRRADNTNTSFFNWWSAYYKEGDSCAALITRSKQGVNYEGKWVPLSCNKRLPFVCRVDKGIPEFPAQNESLL